MQKNSLLLAEEEPPPEGGKLHHPYSLEIVTEISECERLWRQFSPLQTIYDLWEFRSAFQLAYKYPLRFFTLYHQQTPVGLLPLWFDTDHQRYDWFGSYWHEHNNFWVTDPQHLYSLLTIMPRPSILRAINPDQVQDWQRFKQLGLELQVDEPNFALELGEIKNQEDYLQTLKKKTRYNLHRDWKRIAELKPEIIYNRLDDMSTLLRLNTQRFTDKGEEADCSDLRRAQTFKNLLQISLETKAYQIRMISIEIDKKIAVVDFIALYNDTYYSLKGGSDLRNFPGIGNYINLFEINDACQLKMKKIDFLQSPGGWKNSWFKEQELWVVKKLRD